MGDSPAIGAAWKPPREFDGYELRGVLGRGGMGEVYLGHDKLLDRPVAIKFMITADDHARELCLREARAAAKLQHPNVVAIYRVGEIGGHPYIVSEYLRGRSLHQLPLPLAGQKVLELAIGLTRGLAAAHRRGILHRDLKPSNAIVGPDGQVKLIDFGIAEIIARPSEEPSLEPGRGADDEADTERSSLDDPLEPPTEADAPTATVGPGASPTGPGSAAPADLGEAPTGPGPAPVDAIVAAARRPLRTAAPEDTTAPEHPRPAPSPADIAAPTDVPAPPLKSPSSITGTPVFMAPEVLRGEPSSPRSDIYSLGAMLYTLCTKAPPFMGLSFEELVTVVSEMDAPPLAQAAPAIDGRFAAVVDRCLRRKPEERWSSADVLLEALTSLNEPSGRIELPAGNPYRGLRPFEPEHRALFFGRRSEVATAIERLRGEPSLLIVGDSGVGKSSLVRAGILPAIAEGALDRHRVWKQATIVPGRHPHGALLAALAELSGVSRIKLWGRLTKEPRGVGRELHGLLGDDKGAVLVVDQLEELVTVSDTAEAEWVAEAMGSLIGGKSGFRLIMTARADYLSRIGALPGLGDEIARAFFLLRPLSRDKLREVIVGPARQKSVSFESDELVGRLIDAAAKSDAGLPLLQFTLAELWEARIGGVITTAALASIGGVEGALARHADQVLARLAPPERQAAQRILLSLITPEGTQGRRTGDELCGGSAVARAALERLVQGRLVVAREAVEGPSYELAHEALIKGWGTLRSLIERQGERRVAYARLSQAAREWGRLDRKDEGLWSARQLAEADALDPVDIGPVETEFLAASRRRVRRLKRLRAGLLACVPLVGALIGGGIWLGAQRSAEKQIAALIAEGRGYLNELRDLDQRIVKLEAAATAAFDARHPTEGEERWAEVQKLRKKRKKAQDNTHAFVKSATRSTARKHPDAKRLAAEAYFLMAAIAEREHDREQTDYFRKKLHRYDETKEFLARLQAPGRLTLHTSPAGAEIQLQRYEDPVGGSSSRRRLSEAQRLGRTPLDGLALPEGSYLLTLRVPEHEEVRLPLRVGPGEAAAVELTLPRHDAVPPGFVYVPAGRVEIGTQRDEETRVFAMQTVPIHPVEVPAFYISRYEVTYGEWLAYLRATQPPPLSAGPTRGRTPALPTEPLPQGLPSTLTLRPDGRFELALQLGSQTFHTVEGEPLIYPARGSVPLAAQDWQRLPVSGVTAEEALAFAAWLARSNRPAGARLCTEREWERAARGADDREYPHGDVLGPGDANFIETHGEELRGAGPDAVGSHPAAQSPFGVDDLIGNVAEWTTSSLRPGGFVLRGGSFYSQRTRIPTRQPQSPTVRDVGNGLRICANIDVPTTRQP